MRATPSGPRPTPAPGFRELSRREIEQSIVDRFQHQVAEHAERLAVRSADHSLTYRELDQWANHIAQAILARRGQGAEPVALLLDQGAPAIACVLAVLKAGKMYLPLDPAHPAARNTHLLQDAGARFALTDAAHLAYAIAIAPEPSCVLSIDDLDPTISAIDPALPLSGDTHAYLFYTSGSTGHPKGVYDTHRNVLHNVMRYTNSLCISAHDRLTLLQSPSFSGSVSSLFSALLNGAAVFPYDVRRQGLGGPLAAWLNREAITVYHSVPSIFRSIALDDQRYPTVRVVRLEGDAASHVDVEIFRRHFAPDSLLVHGLGATETGITRQFFVDSRTTVPQGIVPLGYATTDMQTLLVDDAGDRIGAGALGEITIRSRYLAVGYWKNPELTRDAFLDDPDGSDQRLYRTGDLGRMRDDGCLEYAGRKNSLIKVRGHRVDASEVENALLGIDGIREAAVTVLADDSGEAHLVAYLVSTIQPQPRISHLRTRLAEALPDFLIPTRFVFLPALPLSDNGKVDRKRLPAPGAGNAEYRVEYVAPRTALERAIAGIWESILRTSPIGLHDDFFDLGGDSLLAATMCVAVAKIHDGNPTLSSLVEAPTLERFAEHLERGLAGTHSVLVPIQTTGAKPPLFCVHAHHGNVLSFAALSRAMGPDQPFYGLQSDGVARDSSAFMRIEDMAARYVQELRAVQPRGPYALGGFCLGGVVAFEMARQLTADGERVAHLILIDNNPTEFPGVVPPDALRRFRRLHLQRRFARHSAEVEKLGVIRGLAYLAGGAGSKARGALWNLAIGVCAPLHLPIPAMLRDVVRANRRALESYQPGPFRGRVTLVLPEEDRELFASDPLVDWGALAKGGYSVHFVRGATGAFFRHPHVTKLAATLVDVLRAPDG